jgi:hypothetical protein
MSQATLTFRWPVGIYDRTGRHFSSGFKSRRNSQFGDWFCYNAPPDTDRPAAKLSSMQEVAILLYEPPERTNFEQKLPNSVKETKK